MFGKSVLVKIIFFFNRGLLIFIVFFLRLYVYKIYLVAMGKKSWEFISECLKGLIFRSRE